MGYNMKNNIESAILLVILMIVLTIYVGISDDSLPSNHKIDTESVSTVVEVSMNKENDLDYNIESLCVEQNSNESKYTQINNIDWVKSNVDTDTKKYSIDNKEYRIENNTKLHSLILSKKHNYIEYANDSVTASKELIFSFTKPSDIDLTNIQKQSSRYFESVNQLNIKSYISSFNNSFIMLNESIGGGKLRIDTLKDVYDTTEETIKTSDKYDGIKIKLKGLDEIKLIDLDKFGESSKVIYDYNNKVFRVTNEEDDSKYFYIAPANNELIDSYPDKFLESTISNLYIHKDYNNDKANGYKTIAVEAENQLYCMKFSDDDTERQVLKQLGIYVSSTLKISKVQSVMEGLERN